MNFENPDWLILRGCIGAGRGLSITTVSETPSFGVPLGSVRAIRFRHQIAKTGVNMANTEYFKTQQKYFARNHVSQEGVLACFQQGSAVNLNSWPSLQREAERERDRGRPGPS